MVKKKTEVKKTEVKKTEVKKQEEHSILVFNKTNEKVDYKSRGFNTIEEAYAFVETKYFKGLGEADQEEFIKWLY